MNTDAGPLVIRRVYHHNIHRVFNAFSTADAVKQWFAPDDSIRTHVTQYDFCEGGAYRMEFTLSEGIVTSLLGSFQTITEPTHLVFSFCWEKPDPHADIETVVSIDFVSNGETTEIIVSQIKLKDSGMRSRHAEGWLGTLHRLEKYLEMTEYKGEPN